MTEEMTPEESGPGVPPVSVETQSGTGVPPVSHETEKTGGTPVPLFQPLDHALPRESGADGSVGRGSVGRGSARAVVRRLIHFFQ
jgi:hypothetical protein